MFGNIKNKLNNAIQDSLVFSENLSSSYLNTGSNSSQLNLCVETDATSLNFYAGYDILERNEKTWKEIHDANEKNAEFAKQIDQQIIKIKNNAEKNHVDLKDLNYCLYQLPAIENTLKNSLDILEIVKDQIESLDEKLVHLQDLCEQVEFNEKQLVHKVALSKYKQEKMSQLEEVRINLASQHIEKLKKYEENLKKLQMERQAVFQDAFEHDLQIFKEKGSLPKVERVKRNDPADDKLSLENIDLNDSNSQRDLESFLNDEKEDNNVEHF